MLSKHEEEFVINCGDKCLERCEDRCFLKTEIIHSTVVKLRTADVGVKLRTNVGDVGDFRVRTGYDFF